MQQQIVKEPTYVFRPQPGRQTEFLASSADIVIYGGSAGSGKTYGLLLEPLRHHKRRNAQMVIFRRDRPRLTMPGALWDESQKIYPYFNAVSNAQRLSWKFQSGATITMMGLQHNKDVEKVKGGQFMLILLDEITEFTEYQFWYLLSRNRSDTGVAGYVRATCNPDSESWVKDLIKWWLQEDGFPDPEKVGKIRWFAKINDSLYWADTKERLVNDYKLDPIDCKSFTFISATIEDNQILLQNDPQYISNLRALGEVEKQRLLFGNWNIKAEGRIFRQQDFKVCTRNPAMLDYKRIYVDTAQKTETSSDYSVMQAWGKCDGKIYLLDQVRGKFEYPELKQLLKAFLIKHSDAEYAAIEDKVSGTNLIQDVRREQPMMINAINRSKDKYTRAFDCQGYVKAGNVYLNCMADYYTDFIGEATAFSSDRSHKHDDQIDPFMDAVNEMLINPATREGRRKQVGIINTNSRIV